MSGRGTSLLPFAVSIAAFCALGGVAVTAAATRTNVVAAPARTSLVARAAGLPAVGGRPIAGPADRTGAPRTATELATKGSSVAGEAPLAAGGGFWIAYSSGVVKAVGTAVWLGDMSGAALNEPIVGIAATSDGRGYWLVAADGGIFDFGDARFFGSTGSIRVNSPVIAMASTGDGRGYWLLSGDGGVFSFGDARFFGSTGSTHLNEPIEGMTPTPNGQGYWLVARDGGIFSFGDAGFHGSTGSVHLNSPIVAMASTLDGAGYWLLGGDGGIFTFGDAPFKGSGAGRGGPADGIVRAANNGYWILLSSGAVLSYGAPALPTQSAAVPLALGQNPSTSTTASATFLADCASGVGGVACDTAALTEINSARSGEGLSPLVLPGDFEALPTTTQSLEVANAERTSRGLPALVESAALDAVAQNAARHGADPPGPAAAIWVSNASWGYETPLAADFEWMYDDGPASSNVDCTATNTSGCWGHRENILSRWGGSAGTGSFDNNGSQNFTQLFVKTP